MGRFGLGRGAVGWGLLALVLCPLSFVLTAAAAPTNLSPSTTAAKPVALLTDDQKDYLYAKTFDERREIARSGQCATLFCHGSPVELKWTGTTGECTVTVRKLPRTVAAPRLASPSGCCAGGYSATAPDGTVVWTGTTSGTSVMVYNLEAGAEYEWTVTCGGASASATFTTEETAPRLVKTGLIKNLRDLGGWTGTLGGKSYKIRQNLIFRGGAADDPKATGTQPAYLITDDSDRDFFYNVVGLKNEVDLRNPNDTSDWAAKAESHKFDPSGEHVAYNNHSIANNDLPTRGEIVKVWRLLTTPAKLPAYFHCKSGRDRTGIVASVLLAVLGVSRDDILRDYQTTSDKDNWTTYGFNKIFDTTLANYGKDASLSLAENASAYLQDCGITAEEIETFRAAMLEGYAQEDPPDDPPDDPLLPAYDMSGVTFADKTVTYNGQKQSIAVGGTLPAGVSVSYEGGGTDASTTPYAVTAHFTGDADHAPIADMKARLTINRAKITSATAADAQYTGTIISPVLTVKAGSLDVPATTGYTVGSWSRATGTTGAIRKDVGKYYATVKGTGNFNGSIVVYFEIAAPEGEWTEISRKLGAETEFRNEPAIAFGAADVIPADGGLTLRVTVAVRDGNAVKAVDPDKVKAYLEATDNLSDWSGGAIGFEVMSAVRNADGTMEFTLKFAGASPRAFVRFRVR